MRRLGFDFDRCPTEVAARRQPVILVIAEMAEHDVRHLIPDSPDGLPV